MRKIIIQFEVPEEYEEDYKDVDPLLVFEDFFAKPRWGFEILSDSELDESKYCRCQKFYKGQNRYKFCPDCGRKLKG